MRRINSFSVRGAALLLVAILGLHPTACSGKRGSKGPPGDVGTPAPTPTVLQKTEDLPGLVVEITGVSGGSRSGGTFQAGDRISVTFTVKKNNGDGLPIGELDYGGILVSGPSTNYQRVIELQSNLTTVSSRNPDGSYTYTFATAIPSTYLAPYNDSASFGSGDGELQGQALLAGTYTVGLEAYKNYTVGVESLRDVGNATQDFLFGGATALVAREVAKGDNCNRCHVSLQAHGTIRRDAKLCLLCHTSGAEDRNVASVAGGTPGVSIDSRVMFHKIHAGAHLPSVLGVAAKPDGTRNYSAPATPYEIVGFQNRIHDYSEVGFPVMPSAYVAYLYDQAGTTYQGAAGNGPMPKDTGFSSLTAAQKLLEDRIRTGVVVCEKCHGDPDGAGPLTAPADGSLWKTQPTRSVFRLAMNS